MLLLRQHHDTRHHARFVCIMLLCSSRRCLTIVFIRALPDHPSPHHPQPRQALLLSLAYVGLRQALGGAGARSLPGSLTMPTTGWSGDATSADVAATDAPGSAAPGAVLSLTHFRFAVLFAARSGWACT